MQIKEDSQWNFVLNDKDEREIDIHAFVYDDKGNIVDGIISKSCRIINRHRFYSGSRSKMYFRGIYGEVFSSMDTQASS